MYDATRPFETQLGLAVDDHDAPKGRCEVRRLWKRPYQAGRI